MVCTRTCAYQGARNVSFLYTYLMNDSLSEANLEPCHTFVFLIDNGFEALTFFEKKLFVEVATGGVV